MPLASWVAAVQQLLLAGTFLVIPIVAYRFGADAEAATEEAVTSGQVFPAQYMRRAFRNADDERVRRIDIDPVLNAAVGAFPPWLRALQIAWFLLATVGSLAVLALLAF